MCNDITKLDVCVPVFWILALLLNDTMGTLCICMNVWIMSSQTTSLGMACYFFSDVCQQGVST